MGRFKELDMEEVICSTCAGSGEVMNLCNPHDPFDGSYHLDGCAACGGTGLMSPDDFKRSNPVVVKRTNQKDSPAFKLAVECVDRVLRSKYGRA